MLTRWSCLRLAAKAEVNARARDLGVTRAQRREPERAVLTRIALVADPDERRREQPDDRGQHLGARHAGQRNVAPRAGADARQRRAECASRPYLASSRTSRQRGW
jgi:hypothetical protein